MLTDIHKQRPLFSKRHYTWLATQAKSWTVSQQISLAAALYSDNTNFKAVRWFQSMDYDRAIAENMATLVLKVFNNMDNH